MRFSTCTISIPVDAHAEGEPARVITGGVGPIPGDTVFAQMQFLAEQQDEIRSWRTRRAARLSRASAQPAGATDRSDGRHGLIIMEQMEYPGRCPALPRSSRRQPPRRDGDLR